MIMKLHVLDIMKFRAIKSFSVIFLFVFAIGMFAQTKDEREISVKLNNFPINAQSIVKDLQKSTKRLRLYKEFDGNKTSYEAKFKYKNNRYSVEFDVDGSLEDIELIIKEKNIPIEVIELYFQSKFDAYNLTKIQKQFINTVSKSDKDFVSATLSGSTESTINYEIIAEVKIDSNRDIMELLFTEKGEFIKSRILKPTSYEHIMY